ncbi:putative pentatricopeptide repeat-containing protein [Heracleum sosnowskyi]|uniref:Pentatricopeptide repeat-containing protein n=1 Tax=Heracleum sosnowskyi TaxID=360622 RepID=A0AAD8IWD5_9APIA|nr:putative pentatricopeptide repeat-containing protein [Heracleum sosnowskyi]
MLRGKFISKHNAFPLCPNKIRSFINFTTSSTHFLQKSTNPLNSFSPYFTSIQNLVNQYKPLQKDSNFLLQTSQIFENLVFQCKNCCNIEDAKKIHSCVIKYGFFNDVFLSNTLINLYVRVGDLGCARLVFDEMSERNMVSWACLVSGYVQNEFSEEGFGVFREMVRAGFVPNSYAIGSVLRGCCALGSRGVGLGLQVHGLVSKTVYAFDVVVCNVLISLYGGCMECPDYAFRVFGEICVKNLVSWNSIISVYSRRGDAGSVFELFSDMQKEGFGYSLKPSEYTFGSLITAACSSVDYGLSLLMQILAKIERFGCLEDLYVGSALVSGFARFGLLDIATEIFKQMGARNAVTLNGLMVGLVRQKRGEEAVDIFKEMNDLVKINSDTYVVLLSALAEFILPDEGRSKGKVVHGYVIRTGLCDFKPEIGNGLINMYAKSDAIDDACSTFKLMRNKNSISWNSLISALDQNERFEDAIMTFHDMRRSALIPSNFTLISALSSCASLGWMRMGEQIHCEGIKLGLDLDVSVSNTLLSVYAESGCITECKKVFSFMPDHDQISWNSIIGAYSNSDGPIAEIINYFKEMMLDGWRPNDITFINTLASVSSHTSCELGKQIHALVIKCALMNDTAIENAFLSFYGKCGAIEECENIFSGMSDRRDDMSWNSMISGYIHNEMLPKAMDLVRLMMQSGQKLDCFTFASVLSACASVATLEHGMEVHACVIRSSMQSDVVIGSALVDMYSKCGRIDYASRFFELMPVRNVYSWNSMISGYARHGHGNKALEIFTKMKLHGPLPDHVTIVGVLSACSHVGLVDEAFKHFESMNTLYRLTPRMEHFSCMVDLLGRAGEFDKLEDFVNTMPMSPNDLIWRTVLGACCRANGRKNDLGRRAADMLLQLEPHNSANYVLLSNMYAFGGKWEDMEKTRSAMSKAAIKKEAGCSWVTMKDGVHVFVAGDKLHPDKDAIYEKLKELQTKMRDAGYVPQTKFALYDLDPENIEELLSYHSERLAIAFVLTRKSQLPIRIMKNLRVCGDCHSAFNYISKIVGRQIVLRDSSRFHHFADGKCSCGDYW